MESAVIKTGGKQYKVKAGDKLKVEKLSEKEKVEFEDLLSKRKVSAKVIGEGKLPKVRILKFKAKKHYKRDKGHRQPYTEIEILKVS